MPLQDVLRDPELSPYVRRWFFDQLAAGLLTPSQARETARRLDIELEGPGYALALLELPPSPGSPADFFSDPASQVRSNLLAYFIKYSEYEPFPCSPPLYAILIQGGRSRMAELIRRCVETVQAQFGHSGIQNWHIAVGRPVSRLEDLPDCWQEVSRLWAWRFIRPDRHVLGPGMEDIPAGPGDENALLAVDPAGTDPAPIRALLGSGRPEDIPAFTAGYLAGLERGMDFRPFRHYAVLSVRFAAARALTDLGLAPERFIERLGPWSEPETAEDVRSAVETILTAAMALRDEETCAGLSGPLGRAAGYIRRHIAEPALSLADAAGCAGLSPSYLSALFRRELDRTFTGYVTETRLDRARQLLRETDLPAGQVARAVGFRDAHYFSALFKKHTGLSPTAYRAENKK